MSSLPCVQDNDGSFQSHMSAARAQWARLTISDLEGIKTKAQLIALIEERYVLPHEVAAEDVEIWGMDRRF
jgi:hypothetical protein